MKKIIFGLLLFIFTIALSYGQKDTLYYKEQVITNLIDVRTLHATAPNQKPQIIVVRKFKTGYEDQFDNLNADYGSDWRDYLYWQNYYNNPKNNGSNSYQNDYEGPQKNCTDDDKCKK